MIWLTYAIILLKYISQTETEQKCDRVSSYCLESVIIIPVFKLLPTAKPSTHDILNHKITTFHNEFDVGAVESAQNV